MISDSSTLRIRVLAGVMICSALVLVTRLYFVQMMRGQAYADKAEKQYTRPQEGIFDRGSIFFESKDGTDIAAATLKNGYSVVLNPKILKNPEDVYNRLSGIIPIEGDVFMIKALKKNDTYEEIAKHVEEVKAQDITALKIPGVSVYKDRQRVYPAEKLASNVIGIIGFKGDVLSGRYGIERYYNDVLERSADDSYVNFFAEIFSDLKGTLFENKQLQGDIVTTIEPTVEEFLDKQVAGINTKWNSEITGGVIMDPKTGEVIALSVYPTFNPNNFKDETDPRVFSNPIVENRYEMGSIIKPLTMASGIDSGAITPETKYNDKGFIILNGSKISNYDGKGRGEGTTMQQILSESLNTGVSFIEGKMGKGDFAKYMTNFGLGEETGIDLPGEIPGQIDNLNSPRDVELATASFGQGIAMTPIITTRALAALANGGVLPNPHVVKKIHYTTGLTKTLAYSDGRQVVKKETADEVTRMLVEVVDKALLNGQVKLPGYSVAAKTGTAQIAKDGGGGYYTDRYLHSFFGYFPAYDPRFIVFLYTVNPKGVEYASHTLTMPFSDITKFLINYYTIPPDR